MADVIDFPADEPPHEVVDGVKYYLYEAHYILDGVGYAIEFAASSEKNALRRLEAMRRTLEFDGVIWEEE